MEQNQFLHDKKQQNENSAVFNSLDKLQSNWYNDHPVRRRNSTEKHDGNNLSDFPIGHDATDADDKKQTVNMHLDLHTNSKTQKVMKRKTCRHCGKVFENRVRLMMHLEEIIKAKQVTCHICKQAFSTWKMYSLHNCTNRSKKVEKYICVCAYCGRIFYSERVLNEHNRTKSKPCKLCKQVFCTLLAMQQHRAEHAKFYECNRCSLTFRSQNGLKEHLAQGHRTFKCSHCNKRLMSRCSMVNHVKNQHPEFTTHSGKVDDAVLKRNEQCLNRPEVLISNDKGLTEMDEIDAAVASISDMTETDICLDVTSQSSFEQLKSGLSQKEDTDNVSAVVKSDTDRANAFDEKAIENYSDTYSLQNVYKSGFLNQNEFATGIVLNGDDFENDGFIDTTTKHSLKGLEVVNDNNELKYETDTGYMNGDVDIHREVPKTESTSLQGRDETVTALASISENMEINNCKETVTISSSFKLESDKDETLHTNCNNYEYSTNCALLDDKMLSNTESEHLKPENIHRHIVIEPSVCTVISFSDMSGKLFHSKRERGKYRLNLLQPSKLNEQNTDIEWINDYYKEIEEDHKMEIESIEGHLNGNKSNIVSDKMFQLTSKESTFDINEKSNKSSEKPDYRSEYQSISRFNADHEEKISIGEIKRENVENIDIIVHDKTVEYEAELNHCILNTPTRREISCKEKIEKFEKVIISSDSENESFEDWDEKDVEEIVLGDNPCERNSNLFDNGIFCSSVIDDFVEGDRFREEISARKVVSGKKLKVEGIDPNRSFCHKIVAACNERNGKYKEIDVDITELHSDKSNDSDSNEDSDGYEECTAEEIKEMLLSL